MQGKRTANRRAAALRQALMLSISSMLVCAMMLVGMTYAWFTDSAVTAVNAIHTGTLNVDLMYSKSATKGAEVRVTSTSKLFTTEQWTPDTIEVVYLTVKNNGTLPVRYSLALNQVQNNIDVGKGNVNPILKTFRYVIVPQDTPTTIDGKVARAYFNNSDSSSNKPTTYPLSDASGGAQFGPLEAGNGQATEAYYALILYYPSDATATGDEKTQKFTLGLRLLAVQKSVPSEKDEEALNQAKNPSQNNQKYTDVTDQPTTTTPETSNSAETSDN